MAHKSPSMELLRARSSHHRVAGPAFDRPEEVIGHFGCMQSQDFAMARWAVARRVDGLTDRDIGEAFSSGRFVRTHVLRPTWHFVLPRDLGWIMRLTRGRVHRLMAGHNKTIDLFDPELERAAAVIVEALALLQPQTRAQLASSLAEAGLEASGTRLAHLVMYAELELLICNGPLIGKQHSYVLTPDEVSSGPSLTEDEALAQLARTYVRGHGPSRPADLAWWSSLTVTQSRRAFELADLRSVTIDGSQLHTDGTPPHVDPAVAALVSPFDESISYVDKPVDPLRYPGTGPDLARSGGLLFLDGVIGGTWSRKVGSRSIEVTVTGYAPLSPPQRRAIDAEAARFGAFLGLDHMLRVAG